MKTIQNILCFLHIHNYGLIKDDVCVRYYECKNCGNRNFKFKHHNLHFKIDQDWIFNKKETLK